MRIVCLGDVHIKSDNALEIATFQEKLLKLLNDERPNYIIVMGDLLDTHEVILTQCLNQAYDFIRVLRDIASTIILVGNHDMINNSQFLSTHHWMNGMKEWRNVTVIDSVKYERDGNFLLCPYVPNGRFVEALRKCEKDFRECAVIFAHQEFRGAKMGAIISETGDAWESDYPLVVSGHIHSHQKPQKNVYYTGSSLQNAFGESENNYVCIYEDGKMREVDLGLSKKKIVYTAIEDVEDVKIDTTVDKVKISISGNYEEFKAFKKTEKFREIVKAGAKIVFKPKRIEKIEKREEILKLQLAEKDERDFLNILKRLVANENNEVLSEFYERVISD